MWYQGLFFWQIIYPLPPTRLHKVFKVIFFLRIWSTWLGNINLSDDHFITNNAYLCIELNGHMTTNLIHIVVEAFPPDSGEATRGMAGPDPPLFMKTNFVNLNPMKNCLGRGGLGSKYLKNLHLQSFNLYQKRKSRPIYGIKHNSKCIPPDPPYVPHAFGAALLIPTSLLVLLWPHRCLLSAFKCGWMDVKNVNRISSSMINEANLKQSKAHLLHLRQTVYFVLEAPFSQS